MILCALLLWIPVQDAGDIPVLDLGQPVTAEVTDAAPAVYTPTLDSDSYNASPTVGITYRIQVEESGPYHIDLRSYAFDAYLVLHDASGKLVAEDDDGLLGTHARLNVVLEAGQEYQLVASALHGQRGDFGLSLAAGAPAVLDDAARRAAENADAHARLAWIEEKYGSESAELATALNAQGISNYRAGRHAETEKLWMRALAIREQALGPEHPEVATSLNNLAALYRIQGRYADAEPLYERALAIYEQALGPKHPMVATSLNNLAALFQSQGRYADAEPLSARVLAIREQALGPEHPEVASSLNNLAALYQSQGRYADAEPLFVRALAIREQALGPEHPEVASSLNSLAALYESQGRYAEAEPLFERALAISEQVYGPEHPEVARSLSGFAALYFSQGRYAEAGPLFERALRIDERIFGPEHPSVATSLNNLAMPYQSQGRFAEAEVLIVRALEIREQALGTAHPQVAYSLNSLAALYQPQGRYAEAEPLLARALAIREQALGPEHPEVAMSLNHLAGLYWQQGRYADAEPLFARALAIREQALGLEHPEVATSLNNLAVLYQSHGRYAETELLYERALAISEQALGPVHPEVAGSLNNLAVLYQNQGRYAEAEPLFERALAIRKQALGPEHPEVASSLNSLASVYHSQGSYAEAEPLYERALAIWELAYGHEHPDVATNLHNLAVLFRTQGRYADAEPLIARALAIREQALGSEHPHVAPSLNNLALVYKSQGRYADAQPLFERALSICEQVYGPEHPEVARSLNNLAVLYKTQGRYADAEPLFTRALSGTLEHLDRELPVMSEADRFRLLALSEGPGGLLAASAGFGIKGRGDALDLCLAWKGKASRLQAASLTLTQQAADPDVRKQIGRIQSLQKQLSDLVLQPQSEQAEDHDERVAALREERLRAERKLNRDLELDEVLVSPTGAELQAQLAPESALVDFHVGEQVFAWVLRAEVEPELIALGGSKPLRAAQETFLRSRVTRGGMAAVAETDQGAELLELLWEPLREAIGDASTVLVSPDGFLCELPFGILPDGEGHLLEKHRFVYLSDATRLVGADAESDVREGTVLAVGDVNYFRADELDEQPGELAGLAMSSPTRSRLGDRWGSLSATRDELQSIRDLHEYVLEWETPFDQLDGKAASEEAVRRSIAGHRYVHIATHGYFEPDELPSLVANAREAGDAFGEQKKAVGLLPGLLSGLVLAGVNAEPEPGRDDGYLSAEEIQYLDLSACDLAVLSACETALGSERAGEGLMSLRRAFEVAGAKTVVSSLWKVDDRATATLMKHFYENYWLEKMPKAEALHQAKLRMLKQNRADFDGNARPETWGAFVLSGDWR